jgi:hypothetical protein
MDGEHSKSKQKSLIVVSSASSPFFNCLLFLSSLYMKNIALEFNCRTGIRRPDGYGLRWPLAGNYPFASFDFK